MTQTQRCQPRNRTRMNNREEGASMSDTATVAVLGAGALGAAMAARLGETGHEVRLWNRTAERARDAAESATRVTAVQTVVEAVSAASVVITVLRDGDAVTEVMIDAIDELDPDAVWVPVSYTHLTLPTKRIV